MSAAGKYAVTMAIWIFVILVLMVLVTISKSEAHEWYAGMRDPVTGFGCCGGEDCAPVPLDATWVQPVAEGFHVILSLEEARLINPNSTTGIDTLVPWERVMVPPANALLRRSDDVPGHAHPLALYYICIWSSQLKCLFVVPST